jgi:hypothetical protein
MASRLARKMVNEFAETCADDHGTSCPFEA